MKIVWDEPQTLIFQLPSLETHSQNDAITTFDKGAHVNEMMVNVSFPQNTK